MYPESVLHEIDEDFKDSIWVLVICYLRANHIARIVEECARANMFQILFTIDGPKNFAEEKLQVVLIETILDSCKKFGVKYKIDRLTENFGLQANLVSSIDLLFQQAECGIIIEDDLVINRKCLEWMQKKIQRLKEDDNFIISAHNPFSEEFESHVILKSNYSLIWGWGTNLENWTVIRKWFLSEKFSLMPSRLNRIDIFWWYTAYLAVNGFLDSWAAILTYNVRKNRLVVEHPNFHGMENFGVDEFAVHTKRSLPPLIISKGILSNISTKLEPGEYFTTREIVNTALERSYFKINIKHVLLPLKLKLIKIRRSRSRSQLSRVLRSPALSHRIWKEI